MSLLDRIKKNSTIKDSSILSSSKFFNKKDMITTPIPALNIALSGRIDGGLTPGLTLFCGPSKHFKSLFSLILAKSYMDKYPDSVLVFYDCEFGTPESYFDSLGIDKERVVHTPIMDMEEFKFDIMHQFQEIKRGDKVIFVVDSLGNMSSKKEMEDAIAGKSTLDMSRAKQMKSIFRMITPYLVKYDTPMIAVNHIYMTQELYSKPVVSGGCVVAGTKIQMFDGSLKSIEDITPGCLVKTQDGPKVVTHSWNPETLLDGNPECYKITFEDGYSVICSDEHPFLKTSEFVPAKDLSIGDDITTL